MLKISFILPCYNVAPYIGRCIESIEHQDMPQDEYEIICVDDCSPDNTGDIIREYQQRYSNIVYHCHETNKTAGGARNTGIDLARGEYIWFVDPDDAIVENVLSRLYEVAEKRKTDILFFNNNYTNENGYTTPEIQFHNIDEVLIGEQFFLKYCPKKRLAEVVSIWSEIFNRDFINENKLRYPEIKSSQDVVFAWKSYLLAKRVSAIGDVCYNYMRRPDSMTGSKGVLRGKAVVSASLLFPHELQKILNELHNINSVLLEDIRFCIHDAVNNNSRKVFLLRNQELKNFFQSCKENKNAVENLWADMNRKTKAVFETKYGYLEWWIMIKCYKLFG